MDNAKTFESIINGAYPALVDTVPDVDEHLEEPDKTAISDTLLSSIESKIDTMNFVEGTIANNQLNQQVIIYDDIMKYFEELDDAFEKASAEVGEENREYIELRRDMAIANVLTNYGIASNREEFEKGYPTAKERFVQISSLINKRLDEIKPETITTEYLTDQMIEMTEKTIADLVREKETFDENTPAKQRNDIDFRIGDLTFSIQTFRNRFDYLYLENKLSHITSFKEYKRKVTKDPVRSMRSIYRGLSTWFDKEQLESLINLMSDLGTIAGIKEPLIASKAFFSYVSVYMNKTKNIMNHSYLYFRIFLMNLSDYLSGILTSDEERKKIEAFVTRIIKYIG